MFVEIDVQIGKMTGCYLKGEPHPDANHSIFEAAQTL